MDSAPVRLTLLALVCSCADALRLVPALRPATGLAGRAALVTMTAVQETEVVSFVQTEMRGEHFSPASPLLLWLCRGPPDAPTNARCSYVQARP